MTVRLLAMLAAVVALAGCSAPGEPEPRTTTSSPATTTSQPSRPAITRPLDASAYRDRVCELLTKAQIKDLDVTTQHIPEQPIEHGRTYCSMDHIVRVSDARRSISLTYWYAADLLGATYREQRIDSDRPLVPVTVAGQPAVLLEDDDTNCTLILGLTNTQGLEISFEYYDSQPDLDPCGRAMEVGEDIVRNLAG
jgi:hypothetical protein